MAILSYTTWLYCFICCFPIPEYACFQVWNRESWCCISRVFLIPLSLSLSLSKLQARRAGGCQDAFLNLLSPSSWKRNLALPSWTSQDFQISLGVLPMKTECQYLSKPLWDPDKSRHQLDLSIIISEHKLWTLYKLQKWPNIALLRSIGFFYSNYSFSPAAFCSTSKKDL